MVEKIQNLDKDLALYYYSGSGGFYALWHILLATNYRCCFFDVEKIWNNTRGCDWPELNANDPHSVDLYPQWLQEEIISNFLIPQIKIYQAHWNIENKKSWKNSEIWPQNTLTENSSISGKIFYYCAPSLDDWNKHNDCTRILVYTDISTQILMCKNKNAGFFADMPKNDAAQYMAKTAKKFNNDWVDGRIIDRICINKKNDYIIKLQDIVKSNGCALVEPLGYDILNQNIEHNNMWINLHNNQEKKLLLPHLYK